MIITNKHGLPEPLWAAVQNDPYHFDGDISTTSLILPPRIFQLRKRYETLIEEDVVDNIWKMIGNNTHNILERIGGWFKKFLSKKVVIEKRYCAMVLGWKVGGQIDLFEEAPGILSDWKVTTVWNAIHGLKDEHKWQLNVNAFLMHTNGIQNINKLQIVMLLRDWSKFKVAYGTDYPKYQVAVVEAPFLSYPEINKYVHERVAFHQSCVSLPDDELPPCTREERWQKDDVYAVMKKRRKSALRLLDSREKAEAWIENNKKGDSITFRPGENTRCLHYCNVAPFCSQFKAMQKVSVKTGV